MSIDTPALSAAGLRRFQELRNDAVDAVTERFYASRGADYAQFGQRGRAACRDDLGFHLEFLRPVLEFGLVQPMVDYLRWLDGVLTSRDVPGEHLALSLDWLGDFFAGHMESGDAAIVVAALHLAKAEYLDTEHKLPAIYGMLPEQWPMCDAFEGALLAGDRKTAESIFDQCLRQGHTLVEAELHMIQPALYGIGQKWQNNEVSVAQEHLATAIAQILMTKGLLHAELPAPNGRRLLLACVAGNTHTIGSQMVADAYQLAGWDVQYLGASVPTEALIHQVGQYKPNLLGLSVSFAQQLQSVKEIVSRLTEVYGAARPPVIIGGLAINQFHRLAGELGADAWSPDALAAVASGARLVPQPGPG